MLGKIKISSIKSIKVKGEGLTHFARVKKGGTPMIIEYRNYKKRFVKSLVKEYKALDFYL
ncbi:hypothetical protein AMD00_09985 [Viridibacillus arvi]|uniref:Uncharacterized protein n=1 Tax=Viridibacillus arvi TaxID=263475 RepID=A0A0M0LCX9_9BACL|nr:hypothetical protein AMD00_09985 [Viridibacillus arvi]